MERAVEWLFSHPDDDGLEASSSKPTKSSTTGEPKHGDRQLPAQYRLKGFISHKGPSVHSGHYVAHLRYGVSELNKELDWVFFNDEKVTKVADGPLSVEALSP